MRARTRLLARSMARGGTSHEPVARHGGCCQTGTKEGMRKMKGQVVQPRAEHRLSEPAATSACFQGRGGLVQASARAAGSAPYFATSSWKCCSATSARNWVYQARS